MDQENPIDVVNVRLLAAAAQERSWRDAMAMLALEPHERNVAAFRLRAAACGIDTSHLRWRPGLGSLSTEDLAAAIDGAASAHQVLLRLGVRPGGQTYSRLREVCAERGLALPAPAPRQTSRSVNYGVSDEDLREAFVAARSIADLLRRVGLVPKGGNYAVVHRRLATLGLDPAALKGWRWSAGTRLERRPLQDLLVAGRDQSGTHLKGRLITEGVFPAKCSRCGREEWNGVPIPLELDHINGDRTDNRLHNLRLLCPNCHAQTPTYRGRNKRRRSTLGLLQLHMAEPLE
jgi:hypothetical protein